jgi:triacylglycerol esterase/lipase EstA (alpha/beta hydrolase family)
MKTLLLTIGLSLAMITPAMADSWDTWNTVNTLSTINSIFQSQSQVRANNDAVEAEANLLNAQAEAIRAQSQQNAPQVAPVQPVPEEQVWWCDPISKACAWTPKSDLPESGN